MTPDSRNTKRATIKDVAAAADVSISTVSLVINEKGYVSAETREQVQTVIRKLNFVPRHAARTLSSQRTGNIGFVIRENHFRRTEPFYTGVFLGTEFEANNRGMYVLLTTIPDQYIPGVHTPRFLKEHNVDGILVAGKTAPSFLAEATNSGLPVVLIDYEHTSFPAAIIDNRGGVKAATQHLIEQGHTRLVLVGADMQHPSLRARRDGFQLACAEAGIPPDQIQFVEFAEGDSDYPTGTRLAERLLVLTDRPTAACCINDAIALAVIDHAMEMGLRVPEDLAVVGFDDVPHAEHARPPLTTVRVQTDYLGEVAMRYLFELLENPPSRGSRPEPHRITIPAELVIRSST